MGTSTAPGGDSMRRRGPEWLAVALHLVVAVFPYGASGLVTPPVGLAFLAALWLVLAAVLWRWRPANAWLTLLVPVLAVVLWFAVISFGEAVFGWTA